MARRWQVGWCCVALWACDDGAQPEPGAAWAGAQNVGALVAMDAPQSEFNGRGMRFYNPATGKAGPLLRLHSSLDGQGGERAPVAFAPDGEHVVFATSAMGLPVWTYGTVAVGDDGAPVYTEVRRFEGRLGSERVQFTPSGERFYTARGWYDTQSDAHHECPLPEGSDAPAVVASPDGRHHLFFCDEAAWLYDDLNPVAPLFGLAGGAHFSADGQYIIGESQRVVDVQAVAERSYGMVELFGRQLDPGDPLRTPRVGPLNTVETVGGHSFGRTVVSQSFGECMARALNDARDPMHADYDLGRWVRHGEAQAPSIFGGVFDRSLMELPERYDGGRATVVGRSGDGASSLVAVDLWELVFSTDATACELPVTRTTRLVRIDLASDAHEVVTSGELNQSELIIVDTARRPGLDLTWRWPFGQLPQASALELTPGALLARADSTAVGGGLGYWGLDAAGRELRLQSAGRLPTPDGRFLLATRPGDGLSPDRVCVGRVPDGAVRCAQADVPLGQPWAVGGHAAPGVRPVSERATVMHVAPQAASDGQAVHLWGLGFGDQPGAVTVGGERVPADAIEAWSDRHVVVRVTPAVGSGVVQVQGPAGAAEGSRPFHLQRTDREPSPWQGVQTPPLTWQQGVQWYPLPGLEGRAADPVSPFIPQGNAAVPAVGGLWLSRRAPYEAEGERWVPAEWEAWFRPYVEREAPGLAPPLEGGWQVVLSSAVAQGPDAYHHFEALAGEVFEVSTATAYRRDSAGAFTADGVAPYEERLPASRWGMPLHPHDLGDGSLLAVRTLNGVRERPTLARIVGFDAQSRWGTPRYDEGYAARVPIGMAQVGLLDGVALVVGRAEQSLTSAAWALSLDGGRTVGEAQADGARGPLAQVAVMAQGALRGFLVVQTGRDGQATGLAHFDLQGEPTWDALPAPAGPHATLRLWPHQTRLYAFDPQAPALTVLDTAAAEPAWAPVAPPEGALVSAFFDKPRERLLLATADAVFAAPLAPELRFEELARPGTLAFGARPQIQGVGVLTDGSLALRAQLLDAAGGLHPIQGMVVRPAP